MLGGMGGSPHVNLTRSTYRFFSVLASAPLNGAVYLICVIVAPKEKRGELC